MTKKTSVMRLLFLIALASVFAMIIPSQSYSEKTSRFVLEGNGFGTIKNTIDVASMQTSLQILQTGKPTFQSGQFLFGDKTYSIKDMDVSLLFDKKFLRLSAVSDDGLRINASGRLAASADDGLIYLINGKTSDPNDVEGFSLFVALRQDDSASNALGIAGVLPKDNQIQNIHDLETAKENLLILVQQSDRVQWKSLYQFTVKIFDEKSNTLLDFDHSSGYVNGVKISATITNPNGQIIKTSNGITQNLGTYDDSVIIPDNARIGTYVLNVTASVDKFNTVSKQFEFSVIPLSAGS